MIALISLGSGCGLNAFDMRQDIFEGHSVYLPDGYKKRGHDRPDNHTHNPKHKNAPQGAEEDHQFVHLGVFADQNRTKPVIDAADNYRTI